jgi:hypothetical protein
MGLWLDGNLYRWVGSDCFVTHTKLESHWLLAIGCYIYSLR